MTWRISSLEPIKPPPAPVSARSIFEFRSALISQRTPRLADQHGSNSVPRRLTEYSQAKPALKSMILGQNNRNQAKNYDVLLITNVEFSRDTRTCWVMRHQAGTSKIAAGSSAMRVKLSPTATSEIRRDNRIIGCGQASPVASIKIPLITAPACER